MATISKLAVHKGGATDVIGHVTIKFRADGGVTLGESNMSIDKVKVSQLTFALFLFDELCRKVVAKAPTEEIVP